MKGLESYDTGRSRHKEMKSITREPKKETETDTQTHRQTDIYMAPGTSAAHILGKCSTCRVWGLNLQIGVETSHPPQWFSLGLRYLNKAQSPK